jgi:hypothetical protein
MLWTRKVGTWGRRVTLPALLSTGLWSCAEPVLDVKVQIVKQTCGGNRDPLSDVTQLRVTVYGDNIESADVQTRFEIADANGELPKIPVGTGRNIVIEALAGELVVSRGETGPLDLNKKDTKETVPATVFLRAVDSFTPSNLASDPGTCSKLVAARAGHTATKLPSGKVLIAGGYTSDGTTKTYVKETEIFDPRTGETKAGPNILPRAFHTATQIAGTNWVLLAGGETDGKAIGAAQLYDEETNSIINAAIPMKMPRTRHVAVQALVGNDGATPPLMLVGGYTGTDAKTGTNALKLAEIFEFDDQGQRFRDVSSVLNLQKGIAEASATPILDGQGRVMVVGGWDGQNPIKDVLFFQYVPSQNVYNLNASTTSLTEAHLLPVVSAFPSGLVVVSGGFLKHHQQTGDLTDPSTVTEYVNVTKSGVAFQKAPLATLPEAAGYVSGTALKNGKILVVGGQTAASGSIVTGSIIEPLEGNLKRRPTTNQLADARHLHATTLLDDGSVLVTGGLQTQTGGTTTLNQIDVFQPAYVGIDNDPHK